MKRFIDFDQIVADMTPIDDATGEPCEPEADMLTCACCTATTRRTGRDRAWRYHVGLSPMGFGVALCPDCDPAELDEASRRLLGL